MLVYEFPLCSSVPSVVIVSLIDNREQRAQSIAAHCHSVPRRIKSSFVQAVPEAN